MEIIIIRVDVIGSLSFIDFVFILINERMEIKIFVMLSKDVLFQFFNLIGFIGFDFFGLKKIFILKVGDVVIMESIGFGG